MRRTITEWKEHSEKLERERDEWQLHALMKMAVKQLACMWCGEIVHAPTGYEPGTPLSEDQRGQAYREHVATCSKHPVAPLRAALKSIADHDGPGFPHGTCAKIAAEGLDSENVERTCADN